MSVHHFRYYCAASELGTVLKKIMLNITVHAKEILAVLQARGQDD